MAQRKIASLVFPLNEQEGYEAGDAAAHRAALAMGDRFDAPTTIAITDALTYLLKMGGQVQMATLREWVDRDGQPTSQDQPGEWRTLGFTVHYETRDAKIQRQKPIAEVMGTPVEDFDRPAAEIEYKELGSEQEPASEEPEQEPGVAEEPVALTE